MQSICAFIKQKRIEELCTQFAGMRVVVAVDRLDPIKGIPHRLLGLEALFRRHPEWVGKVVFVQVIGHS
jgi:trehalose-6-phosphate synthase